MSDVVEASLMLLLVRRFAVGRMGGLYSAAPWVFVINAPWCNNSHFFHMPASLVSDFWSTSGRLFSVGSGRYDKDTLVLECFCGTRPMLARRSSGCGAAVRHAK